MDENYVPKMPPNVPTPKQKQKPRPQYDKTHKALRTLLLQQRPLCEICDKLGKAVPATEAHHRRYGKNLTLEDYMALCSPCHHKLHGNNR